jgi:hypothetical protein
VVSGAQRWTITCVHRILLINYAIPITFAQFTIKFHYGRNTGTPFAGPYPLTVILRSSVLSVRTKQVRYIVRGTKGTYQKFGVDVQEDQMKAAPSFQAILGDDFGVEDKALWGTGEWLRDGQVVIEEYVTLDVSFLSSTKYPDLIECPRHSRELTSPYSATLHRRSARVLLRRSSGNKQPL